LPKVPESPNVDPKPDVNAIKPKVDAADKNSDGDSKPKVDVKPGVDGKTKPDKPNPDGETTEKPEGEKPKGEGEVKVDPVKPVDPVVVPEKNDPDDGTNEPENCGKAGQPLCKDLKCENPPCDKPKVNCTCKRRCENPPC